MDIQRIFKALFWFAYLVSLYLFLLPVSDSGIAIPHLDKIAHLIVFAGLSFLLDQAYKLTMDKKISLLILYGLLIEIMQSYTGRESSVPDAIADLAGVFVYYYLVKQWTDKINFKKYFAIKQ